MSLADVSAIDPGQNTGTRFVTTGCISTPRPYGLQANVFIGAFITKIRVTVNDQSDGHLPPGCMSLQDRTLICSRPYFCSYVS